MKRHKVDYIFYLAVLILLLFLAVSVRAQSNEKQSETAQTGSTFTLEKFVVAGGGRETQQNQTSANNTAGQVVAGKQSSGGSFTLYTGFWTPDNFTPTAANVVVGGRVKTSDGRGIRNVIVIVTFPSGETRTTVSGSFGYYNFNDIPSGETYFFSVIAKRYIFAQPTLIRSILEDTHDIDFVAEIN